MQEAQDLALNLRAGSLPAGVKVMDDRTVGPSLGADSIRRGVTAGSSACPGRRLDGPLLPRRGLNAVVRADAQHAHHRRRARLHRDTWTLPGIAGLVLSIGMAVDSNVLIFERIKEEMRNGKMVAAAIAAGFDRALVDHRRYARDHRRRQRASSSFSGPARSAASPSPWSSA